MTDTSCRGLLVIDKPSGMTSRDVVNRTQGCFPRGTRLGHTGTLDPLATGVLVLCVGTATRLAEYVQRMPKTYRAGIVLGARSDTDDADGTVTPTFNVSAPSIEELQEHLLSFLGAIEQVPPAFSAARVVGRRAYYLARRGAEFELAARRVNVHAIALLGYDYPRLSIEVHCGKGTYIRSLARDLGERLGCGGYVKSLRRTRVGCFDHADAVAFDVDPATAQARLLPLVRAVSELPAIVVTSEEAKRLRQGKALTAHEAQAAGEVALLDERGELCAVGSVGASVIRPVKVFV